MSLSDLIDAGGVEGMAARAADAERRVWLAVLEDLTKTLDPATCDLTALGWLQATIASTRRRLGIRPSPEEIRARTRERVRRHRERRRLASQP